MVAMSFFFFFLLFSRFSFFFLKKRWEGISTTEIYTQQLKQVSNGWLVYTRRNDEKRRKTFFLFLLLFFPSESGKKEKGKWQGKENVFFVLEKETTRREREWEKKRIEKWSEIKWKLSNVWTNRLVCLFSLVIDRYLNISFFLVLLFIRNWL